MWRICTTCSVYTALYIIPISVVRSDLITLIPGYITLHLAWISSFTSIDVSH